MTLFASDGYLGSTDLLQFTEVTLFLNKDNSGSQAIAVFVNAPLDNLDLNSAAFHYV